MKCNSAFPEDLSEALPVSLVKYRKIAPDVKTLLRRKISKIVLRFFAQGPERKVPDYAETHFLRKRRNWKIHNRL